ncbi:class I SAM-dependent methyltransferase [Streptomyces sp. NPDC004610]|uniref:class I SAM-dependent methyltransferase n=1 Tax=unclassified Streptomyces TaxID=2593676 RepID=UPI0033BF7A4B
MPPGPDTAQPPAHGSYVHGYTPREQRRLIEQGEFWKHRLILDGTELPPGTRLLDVGCGAGAVLGVLGDAFPGLRLHGVDIAPAQIAFARSYLDARGTPAALCTADARRLPFPDASFDRVWMMWTLEHLTEDGALRALREARRVLVPGGGITVVEVDYGTIRVAPATPAVRAALTAMVAAMCAHGRSDAGTQLWGWLEETGFSGIRPGERLCAFRGAEAPPVAHYFADALEATLGGGPEEPTLRRALTELRSPGPDTWLRSVIHKATATA